MATKKKSAAKKRDKSVKAEIEAGSPACKKCGSCEQGVDSGKHLVLSPSNTGSGWHVTEHDSLREATEAAEGARRAMSELKVPGRVLIAKPLGEVVAEFVTSVVPA